MFKGGTLSQNNIYLQTSFAPFTWCFWLSTKPFGLSEVCHFVLPLRLRLGRHGTEQRARRLKPVCRYAHWEFTWNTAPMAPGNGPFWLMPRWNSLTLSEEESELCEWQYTQAVTHPYPVTRFLSLITLIKLVRPQYLNTSKFCYVYSQRKICFLCLFYYLNTFTPNMLWICAVHLLAWKVKDKETSGDQYQQNELSSCFVETFGRW